LVRAPFFYRAYQATHTNCIVSHTQDSFRTCDSVSGIFSSKQANFAPLHFASFPSYGKYLHR
jgi:hypothetical protein